VENNLCKGNAEDTITRWVVVEGAWSVSPTQWTMQYLRYLFGFWMVVKTKILRGRYPRIPKDGRSQNLVPDALFKRQRHRSPSLFTTDIA